MLGVASFRYADVVSDQTFRRTQLIGGARMLQADLHRIDELGATELARNPMLTSLWLLRRSCETGGLTIEGLEALHGLALSTLPYLDAPAATALLSEAVPAHCTRGVAERAWLDLYAAVAARDAPRMWQAAEDLLSHEGETIDAARHRYVVAAAMLGRVADDQPEQALRLWERHRRHDAVDDLPDVRLLLDVAAHGTTVSAAGGG